MSIYMIIIYVRDYNSSLMDAWLQGEEEIKLSNHISSAVTVSVSLFRCHDHRAWVALNILSRPCPKLGSRNIEIEGLGFSNLK